MINYLKSSCNFVLYVAAAVLLQACSEEQPEVSLASNEVAFQVEFTDAVASSSTAQVSIYHNGAKLHSSELKNELNDVLFQGEKTGDYMIVVTRDGYLPYTQQLDLNNRSLTSKIRVALESLHKKPVLALMPDGDFAFWLAFKGAGSVLINWGDGTNEKIDFAAAPGESEFYLLQHDYATNPYPIIVTGDLGSIVELQADPYAFERSSVSYINTSHLPALQNFFIYESSMLWLDLRSNNELTVFGLDRCKIGILKLPESHLISHVGLNNLKSIRRNTVDKIVDNVYTNAVAKNISGGTCALFPLALPLSEKSKMQLKELSENYQWHVFYE